ncbi:hypothetical protein PHAVU_010G011200 [Phaseolus vulgaris]|uniref:Uncharacterized protein n=1 Tax=Phaseolus vulgaris TaxID=3885 RepID=V7AL63_PHAVU|nr:hypothetical protein PHAVU_010G011200g [Phaseolus vulgaris]ESW06000.1 hypothetical protein PHAVU_010G011200g [Phaseolus vulgaris]
MEMENEKSITQQTQRPKYDCLLFDLDDTLYPLNSGLANAVHQNIKDYMVEKLGIEPSKTDEMTNLLYSNYGTTLSGLRAIGYEFDYGEYYSFVHGRLPYENLKPDPVLRNLLLSLPYKKLIFTNSDKVHTIKALRKLGLEDCFEGITCFETLNPIHNGTEITEVAGSKATNPTPKTGLKCSEIFDIIEHFAQPDPTTVLPSSPVICKPSEHAIELALKIANLNPKRTLFFEDSVRNIEAGKRVGLHTVLVGKSHRVKGADYAMESIHNLKEAVPELRETEIKAQVIAYPGTEKLAMETSVVA